MTDLCSTCGFDLESHKIASLDPDRFDPEDPAAFPCDSFTRDE